MRVKLEFLEGRMVLSSEIGKAGGGPGWHQEEPLPEGKTLGLESENPSSHGPPLPTNSETSPASVYSTVK